MQRSGNHKKMLV